MKKLKNNRGAGLLYGNNMRRGSAMLDVIMAISIASGAFIVYANLKKDEKRDITITKRHLFLERFDKAIRSSMNTIIDGYTPALRNFDENSDSWGWENNVKKSSPFPVLTKKNNLPYLHYYLEKGKISSGAYDAMKQEITSSYKGICFDASSEAGSSEDLYLFCPLLEDLVYDTSAGGSDLTSPHTLGSTIDPEAVPLAKMSYKKYDSLESSYSTEEYHIPFNREYLQLKNDSNDHFIALRNALEEFFNNTQLREIANVENGDGSGGLNNSDDLFVPWYWKAFGDDRATLDATYCDKAAGASTCDNLDSDDIWRSGTDIKRGLVMERLITNFLLGDLSFGLDGFGNGIYLHPNASSCTGTDLSTCNIDSPSLPQDDYYLIGKPPYVSTLYITDYKDKSKSGNTFGKLYITY